MLVVLAGLMLCGLSFAQDKDKSDEHKYTVSVDTSKIDLPKQADQLAEVLKKHIDGPLGMYYEASVNRNRMIGSVCTVTGLFIVVLFVVMVNVCRLEYVNNPDVGNGLPGLYGLFAAVCLIVGIALIALNLQSVLCPEWVAMNDIIQQATKIVQ
jgi:hypothetical protein